MSSIEYAAGLASEKARQEKRRKDYLERLKRASALSSKNATLIKEARVAKKLGIPSIKPIEQRHTARKLLNDTTEQLRQALKNAEEIFVNKADAAAFVNSLDKAPVHGYHLSELQFFNRYFPSFKSNVLKTVNRETVTPEYLKKLWNQYMETTTYYEHEGPILDFKHPAKQIAFQRQLLNYANVLKDRVQNSSLSSVEQGRYITNIDNAALAGDTAYLDEVSRKLGESPSYDVVAHAPTVKGRVLYPVLKHVSVI